MDKCWSSDIPTDIRKKCDSCFQALKNCVNQFILSGNSPGSLKLANISQVYKAEDPLYKTYYRPHLSKIFKRSIFDKFSRHARKTLRKLLCGFRKVHGMPHALFRLFQSWQRALDSSGYVCTMLMNLPKAYTCFFMIYLLLNW